MPDKNVVDLPDDVMCWVCGAACKRGIEKTKWNGAAFVGQNNVRCWESKYACEPCLCVMSWMTPIVMPIPGVTVKDGSKRDPNWRNYCVLLSGDKVVAYSKGDKPAIRKWLREPKPAPWFAAIIDSGQKHVVPWAPINGTGEIGRVRFEDRELSLGDWTMLDDMTALLTAGASKEEITGAQYRPETWIRCGPIIDAFESRWEHERSSAWFDLAVWLSQRDEEAVAARLAAEKEAKRGTGRAKKTSPRGPRCRSIASDPGGVSAESARECHPSLGAATGPSQGSSEDHSDRGRVADVAPPRAAPVSPVKGQLSLFDCFGSGSEGRDGRQGICRDGGSEARVSDGKDKGRSRRKKSSEGGE